MNRPLMTCGSLAVVATATTTMAADFTYRAVVRSGQDAADVAGSEFTTLGFPFLNNEGQVAFTAMTDHEFAASGIWRTMPGDPFTLDLVVAETGPVPGGPFTAQFGSFGFSFYHALLNEDGNIGFTAEITGMADGDTGVFSFIDGDLDDVALPGQAAPGAGIGVTYTDIHNLAAFTDTNQVAFAASFEGPGVGVGNDSALFSNWLGPVTVVAREGGPAPDLIGSTFGPFDVSTIFQRTANGNLSFVNTLAGPEAGWSVWHGTPGSIDLVANVGMSIPGSDFFAAPSSQWRYHNLCDLGVSFPANVTDGGSSAKGLFFGNESSIETIAIEGTAGPLGVYDDLEVWDAPVNAQGTTVFYTRFNGPAATEDTALMRKELGEAAYVLLQEGTPAAGYGAGVEYDDFLRTALDDAERSYVSVRVRGPGINIDNDEALYVVEPNGFATRVLREGQILDPGDGIFRMVADYTYFEPTAGRSQGINDHGDIVLKIDFSDGVDAIMVAQRSAPCPGDLDGDDEVGFSDLVIVLANWDAMGVPGDFGDANRDGVTDFTDLLIVLSNWGPCFPK